MEHPILDRLEVESVFAVYPRDGGVFRFVEGCDEYYGCDLTADEVLQLAEELKALATSAHTPTSASDTPPNPAR